MPPDKPGAFFNKQLLDVHAIYSRKVNIRGTAARSSSAFRLIDLQIDASIVLCANDFQERADRACGLSLAANDVPHVVGVDVKREKHAALIYRPGHPDIIRIIDDCLDN